jgi:transcription elongation GreA/GreB family factor
MAGQSKTTQIEKENLEAHVELCAERYRQLETRLENIEEKVANLSLIVEKGQMSMIKVLIGTAGTVVATVLSTLVIILTKMP